jgi:hypothetical protein
MLSLLLVFVQQHKGVRQHVLLVEEMMAAPASILGARVPCGGAPRQPASVLGGLAPLPAYVLHPCPPPELHHGQICATTTTWGRSTGWSWCAAARAGDGRGTPS